MPCPFAQGTKLPGANCTKTFRVLQSSGKTIHGFRIGTYSAHSFHLCAHLFYLDISPSYFTTPSKVAFAHFVRRISDFSVSILLSFISVFSLAGQNTFFKSVMKSADLGRCVALSDFRAGGLFVFFCESQSEYSDHGQHHSQRRRHFWREPSSRQATQPKPAVC